MRLNYGETMRGLLPPWGGDLVPAVREAFARARSTLIVMDDDPTGCQTVHGIPILTTGYIIAAESISWSVLSIMVAAVASSANITPANALSNQ